MIDFGRDICCELSTAEAREWLVTNGIGGYASGTVAGLLTRGYHGLLVAALSPPVQRTVLLTKLDETAQYDGHTYPLFANRWANGVMAPAGYTNIERFWLEGAIPVWSFACGDALLEKRIWMQPGANTTYISYRLRRATQPLTLSLAALVNYRDYHSRTTAGTWKMAVDAVEHGVKVTAYPGATPFFLQAARGSFSVLNQWYYRFELAAELERGLDDFDDNLCAGSFQVTLNPGEVFTCVASTQPSVELDGDKALDFRQQTEQELLTRWQTSHPAAAQQAPDWIKQLVLAADQFIVSRPTPSDPNGKTVIAGYHWFTDWGRDTMISLPGLTLVTGRAEIARSILLTFGKFVSQGMLPNRFPDDGSPPQEAEYNTVDATLWYFEAIRTYYAETGDLELVRALFPVLAEIIECHRKGTRYQIHLDPSDSLLYAGQPGVQLTWMDAKVGDWVVTPRIGKPVEVNALWYNALRILSGFAQKLNQPSTEYDQLAEQTRQGFGRFWNAATGYCFDVLDGPAGHDPALRPNQLLAVSLPESPLPPDQQRIIVEICGRMLLTSPGLRSLAADDPQYKGSYGGDQTHRDSAYHQGTVWGWLLGQFALAHLRIYKDPAQAQAFLEPLAQHLRTAGLGSISEIFDGDAPMRPRGCIAQAWSVAETLRAWLATVQEGARS